jgi:RNA polymerase sigma factor for flagellar operon FliA
VRSKGRAVEHAFSKLEAGLHRAPTDAELASELGIDEDELARWMANLAVATVGPLDHLMASGAPEPRGVEGSASAMPSPSAVVEEAELRAVMRREIKRLPERERTVIALYYDEGLTLHEIGDILGVTESRVSQIHTKAVLHLKSRLVSAGVA